MTDNEKLARWQGARDCRGSRQNRGKWKFPLNHCNAFYYKSLPDYPSDDAANGSLLDTLAERGYKVQLVSSLMAEFVTWDCFITYAPRQTTSGSMDVQTRREAVVAACLELIGKEDV